VLEANGFLYWAKQFLGRAVRVEREKLNRLSMVKIKIILFNGF